MDEGWLIAWVLGGVFLVTLIRSAFGFGQALVAVPLLALLIPVEVAAPLAVLVSITVAGGVPSIIGITSRSAVPGGWSSPLPPAFQWASCC